MVLCQRGRMLCIHHDVYLSIWSLRQFAYSSVVHSDVDHYAVLGVSNTATQAEIKTAFYRQSKLHHPDIKRQTGITTHVDDGTMFMKIREAYSVLGDLMERRNYDRTREVCNHTYSTTKSRRVRVQPYTYSSSSKVHPEDRANNRYNVADSKFNTSAWNDAHYNYSHYCKLKIQEQERYRCARMEAQLDSTDDTRFKIFNILTIGFIVFLGTNVVLPEYTKRK